VVVLVVVWNLKRYGTCPTPSSMVFVHVSSIQETSDYLISIHLHVLAGKLKGCSPPSGTQGLGTNRWHCLSTAALVHSAESDPSAPAGARPSAEENFVVFNPSACHVGVSVALGRQPLQTTGSLTRADLQI
jgi:hypothetical protein